MFRPRRSRSALSPLGVGLLGLGVGVVLGGLAVAYFFGLRPANLPQVLPTLFAPTASATLTPPPTFTASPTPPPTLTPTPTAIPLARIAEAEAARNAGDWDTASTDYQKVLAQNSDPDLQASAQLGLCQTRWAADDAAGAITECQAFLEQFSASAHAAVAHFTLGEAYRDQGDWAAARTAYEAYRAARPGVIDSYIYERLAEVAQGEGAWEAAIAAWQAALAAPRAEGEMDLREALAATYAANGDLDSAVAEYNNVYALTDQNWRKARVAVAAGQLLYNAGQKKEAYPYFLDAVNNYPSAASTFAGLLILVNDSVPVDELQRALVNYYAENYEPALAAFERHAEDRAPEAVAQTGTQLYYRGLTLAALKRDTEALAALRELVDNYPADPLWADAYFQIAYIQPYPADADTFVAFVAAAPNAATAPEALFRAAGLHERNRNYAEAVALWIRIADDYPTSAQAADAAMRAGVVLYRTNNYTSALQAFIRAIPLTPAPAEQARAWLWQGKVLEKQGKKAEALAAWQQAAALDPYGYYSLRATELLSKTELFAPPAHYTFTFDEAAERAPAEAWLREKFPLAQGVADLSALPPGVWKEPRFERGAELWALGLLPEAHVEFDSLRRALAGDALAQWALALYWRDLGAYDLTIRAARQVVDLAGLSDDSLNVPTYILRLRYPAPYAAIVQAAGDRYNVHPFLLYAKMRIESFFWKYAYSSADARGLNQIIPPTADDIARQLQLQNFTYSDLYRPTVSIPMGAYYLDFISQNTGGGPAAMLAGYYAGPGNAQTWLDLAAGDPDLFLEVIRLPDAKYYVQTAYEYFAVYEKLYGVDR